MKKTPLLNLSQMARRLGVKPQWLRAEADTGRVPAAKAGDGYLFDVETVEAVFRGRAKRGENNRADNGEVPRA